MIEGEKAETDQLLTPHTHSQILYYSLTYTHVTQACPVGQAHRLELDDGEALLALGFTSSVPVQSRDCAGVSKTVT